MPLRRPVEASKVRVLRVHRELAVQAQQHLRLLGLLLWGQRDGNGHLGAVTQHCRVDRNKAPIELHHFFFGFVLDAQLINIVHQRLQKSLREISSHDHDPAVRGVHKRVDQIAGVLFAYRRGVHASGHSA